VVTRFPRAYGCLWLPLAAELLDPLDIAVAGRGRRRCLLRGSGQACNASPGGRGNPYEAADPAPRDLTGLCEDLQVTIALPDQDLILGKRPPLRPKVHCEAPVRSAPHSAGSRKKRKPPAHAEIRDGGRLVLSGKANPSRPRLYSDRCSTASSDPRRLAVSPALRHRSWALAR
jgi:hypothetical protein